MRLLLPLSAVCLIVIASMSSAQPCNTNADADCDGIVNITELTDYINVWYGCSSCAPDLLTVISAYYTLACSDDPACPSTGLYCDRNMPYSCGPGPGGCLIRQNMTACPAGCEEGECGVGKTYYLTTGGNDSYDGMSPMTSWKTVNKGYTRFNPGDRVLFRRGSTFFGGFSLNSQGADGKPIVFGAYGEGPKPVITKIESVTGWSNPANWTNIPFSEANSFSWVRTSSYAYGQMNSRTMIPSGHLSQDGARFRLKIGGHLTLPVNISSAYIAEKAPSGDPYDMEPGGVVQITFNGSPGANLDPNTTRYSDWIDYDFNHSETHIISLGINGSAEGMYGSEAEYWETSYYKTGGNAVLANASRPDVGGYLLLNAMWNIAGYEINSSDGTESSNIWYITHGSQDPERVWLSGKEYGVAEKKPRLNEQFRWMYVYREGGRMYIYSEGNPALAYTNVEVSGKSGFIIYCEDKDNIVFRDLDLRGGYRSNLVIRGCSNVTVEDCSIGWGSGTYGISVGVSATGKYARNGIIRNSAIDAANSVWNYWHAETTDDGIDINEGSDGWLVYNNTLNGWAHTAIAIENFNPNYTTSNNKVYNNYITCPDIEYGRAFGSTGAAGSMPGNEIFNNIIRDTKTQSQIEDQGIKVYNNIFDRIEGLLWGGLGNALEIYSGSQYPSDMQYYNNLFANTDETALSLAGNGNSAYIVNNSFGNNIFYNNARLNESVYGEGPSLNAAGFQMTLRDYARVLNNNYQNNLFYKPGTANLIYYGHDPSDRYPKTVESFNAMNGTAGDVISGNVDADPLFIDAAARDYRPQYLSPLIDAGIQTFRTADILGNPIYGREDIGPYEYQPPYTMGADAVYDGGSIRIYLDGKYRYTEAMPAPLGIVLEAAPEGGFVQDDHDEFLDVSGISWGAAKAFNARCNASGTVAYAVGGLEDGASYRVTVDGSVSPLVSGAGCADGICTPVSGRITFSYSGDKGWHAFRIEKL